MTLTAVPGIRVGHATAPGGGTGCTVVLGPFRGGVDVRGMATGTRELGVLAPEHVVPRVDAILLTGGSAFGLEAAAGVVAWLEERGRGFPTRIAPVPIVPAAVIYDLAPGRPRPDAAMGRAACEAAGDDPVEGGRVGAGAGALVGKIAGPDAALPGGVGSASLDAGSHTVGALAVVNALGDVVGRDGRVIAGARGPDGSFLGTARVVLESSARGEFDDLRPGENTTLAVVATDAPLSRVDLARVARMASTAVARRIVPVHTPFDGDVTFAVSTAERTEALSSGMVMALGVAAAEALEGAIEAAVSGGEGA